MPCCLLWVRREREKWPSPAATRAEVAFANQVMALRVDCQQAACARAASVGVQLRGSRCGLRSVALACPKRSSASRAAFRCPGGVQSKKDSAVATAKATGEIGLGRRLRVNGRHLHKFVQHACLRRIVPNKTRGRLIHASIFQMRVQLRLHASGRSPE